MPSDGGRHDRVAALFDGHYDRLCRLAFLLVGDTAGAEDIVQEAFLRTFSGWRRIRDPERAHAYLTRAVVNLCHSRHRRRAVEDRGNGAVHRRDEQYVQDYGGPATTAIVVFDAIRLLPTRQRTAVLLRYYADLSEAEMAQAMGCAPGTVKSQLAKARSALSRTLGDESLLLEGRPR